MRARIWEHPAVATSSVEPGSTPRPRRTGVLGKMGVTVAASDVFGVAGNVVLASGPRRCLSGCPMRVRHRRHRTVPRTEPSVQPRRGGTRAALVAGSMPRRPGDLPGLRRFSSNQDQLLRPAGDDRVSRPKGQAGRHVEYSRWPASSKTLVPTGTNLGLQRPDRALADEGVDVVLGRSPLAFPPDTGTGGT
jgi:hypothetical protein